MLYPTHLAFGRVVTLLSIPVVSQVGMFPRYDGSVSSVVEIVVAGAVAYSAGVWGAGYPDLDSPGSKPSNRSVFNKTLSILMSRLGVKHRGRFTHSLDAVFLTFATIFIIATFGLPKFIEDITLQQVKVSIILEAFRENQIGILLLQIWSIFAFIGAMSHLLGDALTTEGIRLTMFQKKKISLVPANAKIGNKKVFDGTFNTGSSWETLWQFIFNRLLLPASLVVVPLLIVFWQ